MESRKKLNPENEKGKTGIWGKVKCISQGFVFSASLFTLGVAPEAHAELN